MLTSITLRNFKSFGVEQEVPLQPLTVLVGPNNSGKSCFASVGRLVRNAVQAGGGSALAAEGGAEFLFHRPAEPGNLLVAWKTAEGQYSVRIDPAGRAVPNGESLTCTDGTPAWTFSPNDIQFAPGHAVRNIGQPFQALQNLLLQGGSLKHWPIMASLLGSRKITLSLSSLRADAEVVPDPRLAEDGEGLPALLALWRGSDPDRATQLEEFVRRCLPEIKHVLVKPSDTPGAQRLWVQQNDGVLLDAAHVSDGVLCFIALAMHAIEAAPGALLFVEEPEQSINPQRLRDLVDLYRRIVRERKCQVVLITHSPTLLNEFRDEPDSILLFRRGEHGSVVDPLSKFPHLVEALENKADPGEMLANGFMAEPS